jgi:hypothetical protein
LAVDAAEFMLAKMRDHPKLFSVTVSFAADNSVSFEPNQMTFLQVFADLWKATVRVCSSVPSVSAGTLRGVQELPISEALRRSFAYEEACAAIRAKIITDFNAASTYAEANFTPYRRIHEHGQTWSEEKFKEKEKRYQPLVREIEKMREYEAELEALKPFHNVGVLNLEARSLKSELLPPVERALLCMKQVLVEIARDMVQGVTKKFARTNVGLQQRPMDVPGFCEFVKFFNQVKADLTSMDDLIASIDEQYAMIRRDQKVPVSDNVARDELHLLAADFSQKYIIEASVFVREHHEERTAQAWREVEGIIDKAGALSQAASYEPADLESFAEA